MSEGDRTRPLESWVAGMCHSLFGFHRRVSACDLFLVSFHSRYPLGCGEEGV